MADLVAAAKKQYEYAKNEYLSGDETKGDEHRVKAEAFIDRIAAGEGIAEPETPVDEPENPPTTNEPLSDDMAEAAQQLLGRYGLGSGASGAEIVAASLDQGREAALVGLLGQPGAVPSADYSLFQQYYEPTSPPDEESGLQSWAPKAEYAASGSGWKHYLAQKGS